ncbi:MAG: cobyric acid synthase, partial [Nitrososphaera sp.]
EVQRITKKHVLGVVPKIEFHLPEEDSLVGGRLQDNAGDLPPESWNWQIDLVAKAIKESVDIDKLTEVARL